MTTKLIKGIDNNVWTRLKAVAAFNNRIIGEELTVAIKEHARNELKRHSDIENKKLMEKVLEKIKKEKELKQEEIEELNIKEKEIMENSIFKNDKRDSFSEY